VLISASAVQAQDSGFYIGFDVGGASFDYDTAGQSDVVEENFVVGDIHAGYQINQYVAVEAGYFATTEEDKLSGSGANTRVSDLRYVGVYGDIVGSYEVVDNLNLLGSLGVAWAESETDTVGTGTLSVDTGSVESSETAVRVGGGLGYDITDNISARTKVDYMAFDNAPLLTYTAGIQYRF